MARFPVMPFRRRLQSIAAAAALIGSALTGAAASPAVLNAADPALRTAVPIGADYSAPTLQRFAQAAATHDTSSHVVLLVFDFTYGVDPYKITNGLRQKNAKLADNRRAQIETACNVVKSAGQTCTAILDDVQIRSEAFEPYAVAPFSADVDGMYVLGGDQDVGMLVVANTPLETAMANAYVSGAAISGNSAGAAVESTNMIAGYTGNLGPENGLEQDSVLLWLNDGPSDGERGLSFGLPGVLLDQHVAQRGRIARLINASFAPGLPGGAKLLGIGVDASTAAAIENETALTDITGRTIGFVADPLTYGTTGHFAGPRDSLSIHHLATQVLAPGSDGYDIGTRQPTIGGVAQPAPSIAGRTFGTAFDVPTGAGSILLGGDLSGDRAGPAAARFVQLAGGRSNAHIVVLEAGFARSNDAAAEALAQATALQSMVDAPVVRFVLDSKTKPADVLAALSTATGVWLNAPDQALVGAALAGQAQIVGAIHDRWTSGALTVLLDNAAAAAIGGRTTTNPAPPTDTAGLEEAASADFLVSSVGIANGLGWLPGLSIEPRLLPDRHWGRLYDLLLDTPSHLGVGLDVETALELGSSGPRAVGDSGVVILDARQSTLGIGTNGAVRAQWVIFDSFVDGEAIVP